MLQFQIYFFGLQIEGMGLLISHIKMAFIYNTILNYSQKSSLLFSIQNLSLLGL